MYPMDVTQFIIRALIVPNSEVSYIFPAGLTLMALIFGCIISVLSTKWDMTISKNTLLIAIVIISALCIIYYADMLFQKKIWLAEFFILYMFHCMPYVAFILPQEWKEFRHDTESDSIVLGILIALIFGPFFWWTHLQYIQDCRTYRL